jgi:hypothetical protein
LKTAEDVFSTVVLQKIDAAVRRPPHLVSQELDRNQFPVVV